METPLNGLIPQFRLDQMVQTWLAEDVPAFEIAGQVVGDKPETAVLWMKAKGVIAGRCFFDAVFKHTNCSVEWLHSEGEYLDPTAAGGKIKVAQVHGKARDILLGERVALNVLARASGIATRTRFLVEKAKAAGWQGKVAGTRKTTPGFRLVEKHAMLVGGADTHRMDLSSMVMLKDNHVWSTGSIEAAVAAARAVAGFSTKIEVECSSEADARTAISAGADVVMLDNFSPDDLHRASASLKGTHPHIIVEASGGITPENIQEYFATGVDVVSTSWIHQGTPHVDFSLKIQRNS